ncbi:MAG: DUF1499 domain-containing protein [Bacteriovoracales bacterium]
MESLRILKLIAIFSFSVMAAQTFKFSPCDPKPNCQNSFEEKNSPRYFYPIEYVGPKEYAKEKIVRIISELDGKIVENKDDYLRAEFTSSIFKFVDDVEIYLGESGIIHLKSKSRIGYWDFGVNKRRLGDLTFRFHQSK